MYSRYLLRTTLGVCLCLAVASWSLGQTQAIPCTSNSSQTGCSSRTGVVLIIVGVAAFAASLYAWRHRPDKKQTLSQASIVGCVNKTPEGTTLKNEKDNQTYGIIADTLVLKTGERVELSGRKYKDDAGTLHMDVQSLVKDLGPCTP
ncbi:MAG TPA: hypothetical protein VKV95_04870 [Terriglobia bacterium]|nr:hypothetical protein [Terriglobia bacterium]